MLVLAPAGFEESEDGPEIELAAYADEAGEECIRAAFGQVVSISVEPGWEDRWRTFHRPVRAGGLWIGPPWDSPPAGEPAVVVDPGRAFGTGAHPTTRACIELLSTVPTWRRRERGAPAAAKRTPSGMFARSESARADSDLAPVRGSVLDAGCGSGVLAVAASRLGFDPVYAVDAEPDAVEAAARTAHENGVAVSVARADVLADELPRVDLVVANIELQVVERLLARRPAATAVTSGYLAHETPRAPGWERTARVELDGWAADVHVTA